MKATPRARHSALACLLVLPLVTSGCLYARHVTNTSRSATEQLLLTTSAERALDRLTLPPVDGRRVSLQVITLEKDAAPYLEAATWSRLLAAGARAAEKGSSDLHLVLRAGAVGTISRELVFGIPPVPIPGSATTVPGLPIVSSLKQRGYTQLRVHAEDRTGNFAASAGPITERAVFDVLSLLVFSFQRDDIYPENGSFEKAPLRLGVD